jgi:AcrR family transcriptional regulator
MTFGFGTRRAIDGVSGSGVGVALMQSRQILFAFVQPSNAEVIPLPLLLDRLPVPPPAALDPVLDATVECLSRHGLSKSSLSDIARELGVAPSTVYRKVGSVENAALLVVAREAQRLLDRMPEVIAGVEGARAITAFLAEGIESFANHPLVAKVLRDEIDWVGRMVTRRLDALVEQAAEVAAPLLAAAMADGIIREQDPLALAHWIVRIGMVTIVSPPPGDLRAALDALLLPALEPIGAKRRRQR